MKARVAVVSFPGSNDDRDALHALELLGAEGVPVWHADGRLPDVGAVVLPGGFSYGDYLRCGAIARFAPAMEAVRAFADGGGPVLGICNGFQVRLLVPDHSRVADPAAGRQRVAVVARSRELQDAEPHLVTSIS